MANNYLSKVPYIEQMQQTECGLCCLAMVLQYYKSQETLAEIRNELDVGRDGLKLSQMYTYVRNRKFFSKVFSCGMSGLKEKRNERFIKNQRPSVKRKGKHNYGEPKW